MKQWTRRRLLGSGGLAAAGMLCRNASALLRHQGSKMAAVQMGSRVRSSAKTLDATKLAPFVDPLLLPELQQPQGKRSSAVHNAVDAPYYPIHIREIACKLHRDLPPSRMWGYGRTSAPVLFEVRSNSGVLIEWKNELPERHILPLGPPRPGMDSAPETRTVTHVHGAHVPSISDGYPEDWFGPGKSKLCFYPNRQEAAGLWAHDHAMGVSRFNVIAGLMGWYILRDEAEAALGLPSGKYELPLLIYDRSFDPGGQLYYPNPPDEGAWSQEFLGDAMVVNGKVQPYHDVEPRKYRLRIANTANSRFFSLAFSNGQSFHIIASDQGLLNAPVTMDRIVLAPAERTDMIVDFSASPGKNVMLVSDDLQLMQFRVSSAAVEDLSRVPSVLRSVKRIDEDTAVRTRLMTLDEFDGDSGDPMVMLLSRKHWSEPVTEVVRLGSVEIWSMANLTQDTHPMHLHSVRFQILDRRNFSVDDYLSDETLRYTGPAISPRPHEMSWKDVVQCPPEMVTRIIVPFQSYAGRYLWHCHILEHEANDMMRPYEVIA